MDPHADQRQRRGRRPPGRGSGHPGAERKGSQGSQVPEETSAWTSERARRGARGGSRRDPPLPWGPQARASAFHQRWRLGPRTSSGGQRGIRTSWQEICLRRVGPSKALTNPF